MDTLTKAKRVIAIALVCTLVIWMGFWVGGKGGRFYPNSTVLPNFYLAEEDLHVYKEIHADDLQNSTKGPPPFWPDNVQIFDRMEMQEFGGLGAVFSTDVKSKQMVLDFYTGFFDSAGWREVSPSKAADEKTGSEMRMFSGPEGIFFLGLEEDVNGIRFTTMLQMRKKDG